MSNPRCFEKVRADGRDHGKNLKKLLIFSSVFTTRRTNCALYTWVESGANELVH